MTQASEAPVRLLSSSPHLIQWDATTLLAPHQIYIIDQCWVCFSWNHVYIFSLLFTVCTKSISALGKIDDSEDILCRLDVWMWIFSFLVIKAVKEKEKGMNRKRGMR